MAKTLHEQVLNIARRYSKDDFSEAYIISVSFPRLANALALKAFREGWEPQSIESRAIRLALDLIDRGEFSYLVPEIT